MEWMANYVPSGWKRDLTHFIGSCWEVQIGSLERDEWHMAITKFLGVMAKKKNHEWTDIKKLMPLQFMPYVVKLFREVTEQDLPGLGHFTGWIGLGGYYHWRVVQQGQICKQLFTNYANSLKLVFSSSYAGCFLPCLLALLFLRVGSLRLFWGMFVRGCVRRDLC